MENMMRIFGAAILAASLLVTNAFAATLPAGKPAGVKKAQAENNGDNMLLIIGGLGLAGLGIGLAVSAGNAGGPTSFTTNTTSTSTGTNP